MNTGVCEWDAVEDVVTGATNLFVLTCSVLAQILLNRGIV